MGFSKYTKSSRELRDKIRKIMISLHYYNKKVSELSLQKSLLISKLKEDYNIDYRSDKDGSKRTKTKRV